MDVLITCDVELSPGLHQRGWPFRSNVASSIHGIVPEGAFGIGWQSERLRAFGLKGVFFLDPMPALLHGGDFLREIAELLLPHGHEIQLHIHTEWLTWSPVSPVGGRQGRNIADFAFADQVALLDCAIGLLTEAGIPRPTAFRAGNYGANDDTLRALASLGLLWDTSFNPCYAGAGCAIGLPPETRDAVRHQGVAALPIAAIHDRPGRLRHAQVCALSEGEMRSALRHAARVGQEAFVVVTHSFEMLTRDRARPNRLMIRRFEALCEEVARQPGLDSAGFRDLDPTATDRPQAGAERLPPSLLRTGRRLLEQGLNTVLCERRLLPP